MSSGVGFTATSLGRCGGRALGHARPGVKWPGTDRRTVETT